MVRFDILTDVDQIETIASGLGIRNIEYLRRRYGPGRWRKLKGVATVRLPDGVVRVAEIHRYEANGIGRRDFKIKELL